MMNQNPAVALQPPIQKPLIKRLIPVILILFVLIAFGRAMGCWDNSTYSAINHGNHKHYMPNERDAGIGMGNCPTRPPAADEFFSRQCQIIRQVAQNGKTYYIPDDAQEGLPITTFPTQAPGPGERISPQGQVVKVTVE
ncbi:MAG: hypothetical protein JNN12_09425 [Bacteroidetes Order II. Incertae sedis bacterium]|nr:hypothetical protein [Bacteroidetes Order II. bacterium]